MTNDTSDKKKPDSLDAFLDDVDQLSSRAEENAFMEGLAPPSPPEGTVEVGERLRAVRERRQLTVEDISGRTDIPLTELLEIETGAVSPPLGTLIRLAKALEMKMGYFISGEESAAVTVVRRNERRFVSRYDSKKMKHYGYEYQSLAPKKKDRQMDPFLITLEPSATEDERSTHDGQEYIFVLTGRMEVRLGDEIHVLDPGDSIYYDSTVPHLVKCHGTDPTQILAVFYTGK